MGKPAKVGRGVATAAAAGGAVDHVANQGQARKAVADGVSNAVGSGGSSTTNVAETAARSGSESMVTGLPPATLALIAAGALVILAVGLKAQD